MRQTQHNYKPMKTISKSVFDFLNELSKNNNRQWFDENRDIYKKIRNELKEFSNELIFKMAIFDRKLIDDEVTAHIFRINRDTRFSKNKLPYKTNLGVLILPGGRKAMQTRAGYYIHIEPGNSFLGGGAHMPPSDWIGQIRDNIIKEPKVFKKIIQSKTFTKYYSLDGAQLKTAPRGYSKEHPEIKLLRYKSFTGFHPLTNKQIYSPDLMDFCAAAFKAIYPLNEFLNKI